MARHRHADTLFPQEKTSTGPSKLISIPVLGGFHHRYKRVNPEIRRTNQPIGYLSYEIIWMFPGPSISLRSLPPVYQNLLGKTAKAYIRSSFICFRSMPANSIEKSGQILQPITSRRHKRDQRSLNQSIVQQILLKYLSFEGISL
jgi:hypothetical protein